LSAGCKSSSPQKSLTCWRANDRHHQQGAYPAHHRSHSQTGEVRRGIISKVKIQLTTKATHILESQGQALLAGSKSSSPWKPLTDWRGKDRDCQQGPNQVHHKSHSHPGKPRTGIVSRVQIQLATEATHSLESQGQVSSAGGKYSSPQKPLTTWRAKALSAGSKSSSPQKPLTNWRTKDRHHQQGPNPAHHGSHSRPGEPRTGIISRAQFQLTMEATHSLESQVQVLSAGPKSSLALQPLTF